MAGPTIGEVIAAAPKASGVIRPLDEAVEAGAGGAFAVVRGSLAPDGAVIKTSAATPGLLRHRGPAVVFRGYEDMRAPGGGPGAGGDAGQRAGARRLRPGRRPGMPEWGMIPIPAKLAAAGVRDMVRVTDARMSGTSFGTVFLHVAPEAAVGGPLALVRDGDMISVDAAAGVLDLDVGPEELARRRAAWSAPASPHLRGWPALYRASRNAGTRRVRSGLSHGADGRPPAVRRACRRAVLTMTGAEFMRFHRRERAVRRWRLAAAAVLVAGLAAACSSGGGSGGERELGPGHADDLAQLRHRAERDRAAEPGQGVPQGCTRTSP